MKLVRVLFVLVLTLAPTVVLVPAAFAAPAPAAPAQGAAACPDQQATNIPAHTTSSGPVNSCRSFLNILGLSIVVGNKRCPTTQFLPFPTPGIEAMGFKPQNFDAGSMLGMEGLWARGMTGKGTTVAVLDSGLDPNHPDFAGRVVEYVDMTPEADNKDGFGHGTHVAGSLGGSGAASGGRHKGTAPDTKFVIFKVFDKNGNTTEDTECNARTRFIIHQQAVTSSLDSVTSVVGSFRLRLRILKHGIVAGS